MMATPALYHQHQTELLWQLEPLYNFISYKQHCVLNLFSSQRETSIKNSL